MLAGLSAAVGAPECSPELRSRLRVLELRRGAPQHLDRLLDEGGVRAADRVEVATLVQQLRQASGRVAAQDAQSRTGVAEKEQAGGFGKGLSKADALKRGRGLVQLALLHEGVGEERSGVSGE